MPPAPPFDLSVVHQWFSAEFFNEVWELLNKTERTPEEDETMVSLAHASLAHWRKRDDCGSRQISVGCWQISRVYAVLGNAANAQHYGQLSLEAAEGEGPFYLGYAHEALARAAKLASDEAEFRQHLDRASELAGIVDDPEEKQLLEADLAELA